MKNSGFKDIPMPPRIERLARTRQGYPIPYIAQWSGEEFSMPPKWDDRFGEMQYSVVPDGQDRGHAILGQMHDGRQIECFLEYKCQVCAISLKGQPAWMAGSRLLRWYTEPPVCTECIVYSLQVCPGLLGIYPPPGSDPEENVRVVAVNSLQLAQLRLGIPFSPYARDMLEIWRPGPVEPLVEYIVPFIRTPDPIRTSVMVYLVGRPTGPRLRVSKFLANHR